jgi:hypothetical protein
MPEVFAEPFFQLPSARTSSSGSLAANVSEVPSISIDSGTSFCT